MPGPINYLLLALLGVAQLWAVTAILLGGGSAGDPSLLRVLLAVAYVTCLAAAAWKAPHLTALGTAAALFVLVGGWYSTITPSHERQWSEDQSRLAHPEIHGDILTIADLRDFRYRSESDWDARWRDATYDLRQLKRGWFIVEHFSEFEGAAHAMATFEFDGGQFLAVSVEIRKEQGESYSPLRGLFRQYEVMYVVADERDALQLRTNYRPDSDLYLYEVDAGPEATRAFLEDMMARAARIAAEPAFYNSLVDTCASNLATHLTRVSEESISPLSPRVLLPGYSHQLAWDLKLLGDDPLEELKAAARTRPRAAAAKDSEDYSLRIRGL
ncbi:MAG: DUF4105 domain-containing protein [Deltaproteobacteria bacterium]|nr:DUF4105 domain-containing protein [Deltaproteobacteria bacterium]